MKPYIKNLAFLVAAPICFLCWGCSSDNGPTGGGNPPGTPADLVLQNSTLTAAATYTATNSITAGPNFTIANGGAATFVTRNGLFYFRPGFTIVAGGSLKTIKNPSLAKIRAN